MSKVTMVKLAELDIKGKYKDLEWRLSESTDPDFLILSITFGHALLLSKEYAESGVINILNKKGLETFIENEIEGYICEMRMILQYIDHMELKNKD